MVIGGGIAGLSLAGALSESAAVTVLEAEEQVGFHSSGRSATMLHYALGNPLVRALTLASRELFENPPDGFSDIPLGHQTSILVHAREEELAELDALEAAIAPFASLDRIGEEEIRRLCPLLRTGSDGAVAALVDPEAVKIDSDALLQGHVRTLRNNGGTVRNGARVAAIERRGGLWEVRTEKGDNFAAPLLVNAAGSWADQVAALAGLAPLGLHPKRRTIVTFDAPAGTDISRLPFTKTVGDELYFGAESGRIFASPMDEVPSEPCDAQPDDYEVALAAWRIEERTYAKVERIHSKWAGLRTFTPDGKPAVGFAPASEGFFWLAGQGGFGLQTSPAIAAIAASLILERAWPVDGASIEELSPDRFLGHPA